MLNTAGCAMNCVVPSHLRQLYIYRWPGASVQMLMAPR
ncbi:hypothetical protein NOC27_499 [Nitrosococcus oceani AFC27]|nr:hypothetical protein NOC27_499 [Nitrosococcus oceani AFC27]